MQVKPPNTATPAKIKIQITRQQNIKMATHRIISANVFILPLEIISPSEYQYIPKVPLSVPFR